MLMLAMWVCVYLHIWCTTVFDYDMATVHNTHVAELAECLCVYVFCIMHDIPQHLNCGDVRTETGSDGCKSAWSCARSFQRKLRHTSDNFPGRRDIYEIQKTHISKGKSRGMGCLCNICGYYTVAVWKDNTHSSRYILYIHARTHTQTLLFDYLHTHLRRFRLLCKW